MTLIYAHRGSSARYAEHTRAAYLQAMAELADGVECDVHLTADQRVVLLHDSTVDRTSDGSGAVADKTLAELRTLDFSSWKGVDVPDEFGSVSQQFLTLDELLDLLLAAERPLGLAIEFKHPNPFGDRLEEATLELLLSRGWLPQSSRLGSLSISFMSFDPDAIEYLSQTVPARHLCQLVAEVKVDEVAKELGLGPVAATAAASAIRASLAKGLRLLDDGEAGIAGPGLEYLRAMPEQIQRWFDAGRTFRVWTVDEPEDVRFCLDSGVQEITTNKPAEVRALL
ncbi:glycerophosphodiester phosphodiesterase family protein [Psychromicrobium sp. YIM B11713]|uniref:glycerophosphodiester phosphodiesterase family protein n=1 Tax=Psychromicrobium sp. YIM B11713 TaxID=3145233 RepID=UPI00374E2557